MDNYREVYRTDSTSWLEESIVRLNATSIKAEDTVNIQLSHKPTYPVCYKQVLTKSIASSRARSSFRLGSLLRLDSLLSLGSFLSLRSLFRLGGLGHGNGGFSRLLLLLGDGGQDVTLLCSRGGSHLGRQNDGRGERGGAHGLLELASAHVVVPLLAEARETGGDEQPDTR